jgi:excisionase family DNA binding protein
VRALLVALALTASVAGCGSSTSRSERGAPSAWPEDLKGFAVTVSSAGGEPGLVSVREVADQLGVHPETVRRLIHDGRLDAVRVGRVLRVHRDAVDHFLARQRVKPTRFQA